MVVVTLYLVCTLVLLLALMLAIGSAVGLMAVPVSIFISWAYLKYFNPALSPRQRTGLALILIPLATTVLSVFLRLPLPEKLALDSYGFMTIPPAWDATFLVLCMLFGFLAAVVSVQTQLKRREIQIHEEYQNNLMQGLQQLQSKSNSNV